MGSVLVVYTMTARKTVSLLGRKGLTLDLVCAVSSFFSCVANALVCEVLQFYYSLKLQVSLYGKTHPSNPESRYIKRRMMKRYQEGTNEQYIVMHNEEKP